MEIEKFELSQKEDGHFVSVFYANGLPYGVSGEKLGQTIYEAAIKVAKIAK